MARSVRQRCWGTDRARRGTDAPARLTARGSSAQLQPLAIACPRANSAFPSGAARGSASKPARAQRAQMLPEGPCLGFSVRDPASPGVACFTSVPQRALLARCGRSKSRHPSQYPEAHGQSSASSATSGSIPLTLTARGLDSCHPSQFLKAHRPSVPRTLLVGTTTSDPPDVVLAERSDQRPSQRAQGHKRSVTKHALGRHPSVQRRGPPAQVRPSDLHRAQGTARVLIPTQASASAAGATAQAHKMQKIRHKDSVPLIDCSKVFRAETLSIRLLLEAESLGSDFLLCCANSRTMGLICSHKESYF
jgi:hypothetical protein